MIERELQTRDLFGVRLERPTALLERLIQRHQEQVQIAVLAVVGDHPFEVGQITLNGLYYEAVLKPHAGFADPSDSRLLFPPVQIDPTTDEPEAVYQIVRWFLTIHLNEDIKAPLMAFVTRHCLLLKAINDYLQPLIDTCDVAELCDYVFEQCRDADPEQLSVSRFVPSNRALSG